MMLRKISGKFRRNWKGFRRTTKASSQGKKHKQQPTISLILNISRQQKFCKPIDYIFRKIFAKFRWNSTGFQQTTATWRQLLQLHNPPTSRPTTVNFTMDSEAETWQAYEEYTHQVIYRVSRETDRFLMNEERSSSMVAMLPFARLIRTFLIEYTGTFGCRTETICIRSLVETE